MDGREIGYTMGYNKAVEKFEEWCEDAAYCWYDQYVVDMKDIRKIIEMMREGEN